MIPPWLFFSSSLLIILIVAGVLIEALGLFSTFLFHREKIPNLKPGQKFPGVTIIKPCRENEDNEEKNFDAFFNQDYPGKYELLFIVGDYAHPIVPVIRQYLDRYPHVDARLLLCQTQIACSPKINSLYDGHRAAKHEIIIWSDSDVIVRPNYVSQMTAALSEPEVSLVTTPQYDTRVNTVGGAFKVLGNNCDVATFIMGFRLLKKRQRIAWGHSLGFRKSDLDELGPTAWDFLFRFLADDLALPILFDNHGKKVVFRNIFCPVETSNKTVMQMVSQKKRWVLCQRSVVGNRWFYLAGLWFYPQIPATFLVLISGFAPWALLIFGLVAISRVGISAIFEWLFLDSLRMNLRYFWTILLWDLAQVYFFWYGFTTNRIYFRGKAYRVLENFSLSLV